MVCRSEESEVDKDLDKNGLEAGCSSRVICRLDVYSPRHIPLLPRHNPLMLR